MRALLIAYDNESFLHYFPLGLAYIVATLKQLDVEVILCQQDIYHLSDEGIREGIEYYKPDFVGIGTVAGYYPYRKLLSIAKEINNANNRSTFKFIISGHMASASPDYILQKSQADIVIRGEGEETIKELVKTKFEDHKIKGTSWRIHDGYFTNDDRELIQDLDTLPMPAYEKFMMEYYRLQRMPNMSTTDFSMSMITGRGCTFKCNFCYRLMPGMRLRSIKSIIAEMQYLKNEYQISYIDFADDLTMASKQRTFELCEAMLEAKLDMKWRCEGRLNYASEDTLKIMKKAGCVFINYGIEALDDEVLKTMNKALTVKQITEGVENTINVGISPGLNIIFGHIGDTIQTLEKAVDFLLKYDDCAQIRTIRPVTPYPGCELFEEAKRRGLIKDVEDFYENKHVNSDLLTVNFTSLTDDSFYEALYKANSILLDNYERVRKLQVSKQLYNLYIKKDTNFRGFRQT